MWSTMGNLLITSLPAVLLCAAAAYLLGSFNSAIVVCRLMGREDVRNCGSGNAGATNMARVFGMSAGLLTLAGDMLKTAASCLLGYFLCGDIGMAVGGCACLFGHCFPVLHSFRGGKGVSSGAMIALVIDWRVFLCVLGAFLVAALLSKKVSLGSICGALTIFIASLAFHVSVPRLVLAGVAMLLVVVRHRENILRIVRGTEPDFKPGKSLRRGKDEC